MAGLVDLKAGVAAILYPSLFEFGVAFHKRRELTRDSHQNKQVEGAYLMEWDHLDVQVPPSSISTIRPLRLRPSSSPLCRVYSTRTRGCTLVTLAPYEGVPKLGRKTAPRGVEEEARRRILCGCETSGTLSKQKRTGCKQAINKQDRTAKSRHLQLAHENHLAPIQVPKVPASHNLSNSSLRGSSGLSGPARA